MTSPRFYFFSFCSLCSFTSVSALAAQTTLSPEEDTLKVSTFLKPISTEKWQSIAGDKLSENYEISKGETLSGISERLFGDPKYWPKIWAINHSQILNPHVLNPGQTLHFESGSVSSLPTLTLADLKEKNPEPKSKATSGVVSSGEDKVTISKASKRSSEWKHLPRQRWENISVELPPQVDPLGFDKRSRVVFGNPQQIQMPFTVFPEKVSVLGEITGSPEDNTYLSLNAIVAIEPDSDDTPISIGETYTIIDDPQKISSESRSDSAVGYLYPILGTVKIFEKKSELYYGRIHSARDIILRDKKIIPHVAGVTTPNPVAGTQSLKATYWAEPGQANIGSVQYKFGFIDAGTNENIQSGMIFRTYRKNDPVNNSTIADEDVLMDADFMVLKTLENFSIVTVFQSNNFIPSGTEVTLLTDLKDFNRHSHGAVVISVPEVSLDTSLKEPPKEAPKQTPLETPLTAAPNELDELDQTHSDQLNAKEKNELEQLETWSTEGSTGGSDMQPPAEQPTADLPDLNPPTDTVSAPPPSEFDEFSEEFTDDDTKDLE